MLKPDGYSLAANTHTVTYKESHSNSFSERRNINDSTPSLALFTRVRIIWRCPVHTCITEYEHTLENLPRPVIG